MQVLAKNRKATFDHELLDRFVAGVQLFGHEVKSIKQGQAKIEGAYVWVSSKGAILRNANIPLWEHANAISAKGYEANRDRILLLTKKQIETILTQKTQMRAQIVPVALLLDKNLIKLEIALARSLKKFDRKNIEKERDEKLATARMVKTSNPGY